MWSGKVAGVSRILGLLAIVPLGIQSAEAQDTAGLSGQEILARVATTYAHCMSYQDTGVVTIVYLESSGSRTEERPFRTAFVRPDRFRFEYQETGPLGVKHRYIICRAGSRVQTWWDVKPGIEAPESLNSALAAATGVSGGSAHTIPVLLLPGEVEGRRLTDMTDGKRIADANLGGVSCFRVEGKYANVPRTVWVEQRTFLVRRIEFESSFPKFRTQETTTYEPVIDKPVAQELLEFGAPAQK